MSLENTEGKVEVARNEQFSFSLSVFYQFDALSAISVNFKIVICKLFQFARV